MLAQLGYVGRLLERRPTLAQHRRLLVAAGWLSVLVAQLSFEAGDREAAEASRDAAFRLARQAGHAELAAWSVEALALWALADGRFTDALELAQSGQDLAPPASAAAVQLALDEAQAWSSLGDQGRAAGARHQAALTRAMLPTASCPGRHRSAGPGRARYCVGELGLRRQHRRDPREPAVSDLFAWPTVLGPLLRREDLSEEQAGAAMGSVLAGEATPAQIAAFAIGLRIKGETAAEMTGMVKAMLAAAAPLEVPGPLLDTCGTGGDRAGTFNVSTLAALVAAGAGQRVAKHGNRAASGRCGSADLLEALGVAIDLPPEGVAATHRRGRASASASPRVFHPAMRHAGRPRRELGVPTVFNFLGPLANPARAGHQALGVADPRMAPVMAEVLRRTGVHHALVFYGHDGLDELTTTTTSTLLDVSADGVRELVVDPTELGLAAAEREDLVGGDVDRNVAIAKEVLDGQGGPARDMVLLNTAAALVAADAAISLPEGLEAAARSIDDGRARDALDAWVESSRRIAAAGSA